MFLTCSNGKQIRNNEMRVKFFYVLDQNEKFLEKLIGKNLRKKSNLVYYLNRQNTRYNWTCDSYFSAITQELEKSLRFEK